MASRRPFPPWMLLDRFVRRRDGDAFPASDPTTTSLTNSRGDPFDVCLCSEKPPQPSFVYVRWPNGPEEGEPVDAAAAHGGAVLLLMHYSVPVRGGRLDTAMIDYVVYDPAGPSLRLLPSLLGGSIDEVRARAEADKLHLTKALARRMESFDIGIVHRGPGDFAVAELQIVADAEGIAAWPELRVFNPSVSDQWVLKTPRVVPVHPRDGLDVAGILRRWDTDAVAPVGECLCWVDYTAGVMLCNVFDERYEIEISFLELPVKLPRIDRGLLGRGWLEAYHGVGATKEGDVLKFACVRSDDDPPPDVVNRYRFRIGQPSKCFVVTTWSLSLSHGNMSWKEEGSVTADELTDQIDHLPREILMYPTFNLDNSDDVSFVLKKEDATSEHGEIWLVVINVVNKTVSSSMLYIKDKDDCSPEEAQLFETKIQHCEPFLPVEMPKNANSALSGEIASTVMETLETKLDVTHHPLSDQPEIKVCF